MEEEIKQDVNTVEPSATEQESSNEVQEVAQPEKQEVVETPKVEPAPEVRQPQVEPVDEMGVPLKNRLAEAQRKLRKYEEQEKLKQQPQQQSEPKYTVEQLKAFAISAEDPQHRAWALNELDKVSEEKFKTIARTEYQTVAQQQQEAAIRQQTLRDLTQRNPDVIIKDSTGNMGFNMKNPLAARMQFYMQNPDIVARPDALMIAEKFAAADLYYAQKPVVAKTIAKQASEIKSIQKKTMVEGGGNNSNISVSPRQAAIEKAKQTGHINDAAKAMAAVLRESGTLSDE